VKKRLVARNRLIGKVTLIPDESFVVEERVVLRVPVTGNFEYRRFAEVVLDQATAACLRSAIKEKAVLSYLSMEVIKATVVGVYDVVPIPVKTECIAMIDINQYSGFRLGPPNYAERNDDREHAGRKHRYVRLHRDSLNLEAVDAAGRPPRGASLDVVSRRAVVTRST
jgi:hypothetical protein